VTPKEKEERLPGYVRWGVRVAVGLVKAHRMDYVLEDLVSVALNALSGVWRGWDGQDPFETIAFRRIKGAVVRAIKAERRRASLLVSINDVETDAGDERGPAARALTIAESVMDAIAVECVVEDVLAQEAVLLEPHVFDRLRHELERLGPDERKLLDLRHLEDQTWDEISKAMDTPKRTLEHRHKRLREKLKAALLGSPKKRR
jgi:RNA polymerase sigma factor (sigma-70 family)